MQDTVGEVLGDPPVNAVEGREAVLNVAKLAACQERYCLDSVPAYDEDYYLAEGEELGQWSGRGPELLDLDGADSSTRCHVLDGRDPNSGVRFTRARKDRVRKPV
jgi:hypothetical protein